LGVQAARQAPRYVPVARVRQVMRTAEIEEMAAVATGEGAGSSVSRMFKPETGGGAEMLSGSPADIAGRIIQLIRDKGVKI
jgi:electron transfer flavoprotein beta subunit